jgi:hypothetical protein
MQQNIEVFFLFFQFSGNKKNIAKQLSLSFNNNTSLPEADAKVRKNPQNTIQNKKQILNKSQQTDLQIFTQPLSTPSKVPALEFQYEKKCFFMFSVSIRVRSPCIS